LFHFKENQPMTDHERIPLVLLATELVKRGHTTRPPLYREVYTAIANGRIPAQRDNGRWYIQPHDLPLIVQALCHPSTRMASEPAAANPPPRRARRAAVIAA
jgi:hypothetical protein